jgi:hypothetical protein
MLIKVCFCSLLSMHVIIFRVEGISAIMFISYDSLSSLDLFLQSRLKR